MSSKVEKLVDFYSKVLRDNGVCPPDGKAHLSYVGWSKDQTPIPVTIDGKRLCLSTTEVLRNPDWDSMVIFHPFSEQINQGPSPVLNALKNYIIERVKITVVTLASALAELAAEPKRHKSLNEEQSKFMENLIGFDQTTVKTLGSVFGAMTDAPEKRLITLFLKNGGEGGALRTCMVSFPIMDDVETEDKTTFFGVKMPRKTKDKDLIVNLLNYVLGDGKTRKGYTQSSNDREAPYFHALLLTFSKIAKHLNDLVVIHTPACEHLEALKFNLDWFPELEDFANFGKVYGNSVPTLPGNRGRDKDSVDKGVFEADSKDLGGDDTPFIDRSGGRRGTHDDEHTKWNDRRREEREERTEGRRGLSLSRERDSSGVKHFSLSELGSSDRGRGRERDRDEDRRGRGREESGPKFRRVETSRGSRKGW